MKDFDFFHNNFDLIRLFAALQVVFIHGYEHFGLGPGSWLVKSLQIFPGVPIFFVISGFLVSASWERSAPQGVGAYFKNRFLRIYPALWVCFFISLGSVFIIYKPNFSLVELGKWVIAQLTIGQIYNPDILRGYGVGTLNGSLWTIPVEIQFYILLPLIYFVFNRKNWNPVLLGGVMIGFILINQVYLSLAAGERSLVVKLFGVTLLPYLFLFLLGLFLQKNLKFVAKYLKGKALLILLIYIIWILISHILHIRYLGNYLNPISALILGALTISFAYSYEDRFSKVLRGNDISYGVYIYHMVVVNALLHISRFSPLGNLLVMFLLTISISFLSWKLVEKPALALKKTSLRDLINNKTIRQVL